MLFILICFDQTNLCKLKIDRAAVIVKYEESYDFGWHRTCTNLSIHDTIQKWIHMYMNAVVGSVLGERKIHVVIRIFTNYDLFADLAYCCHKM